MEDPFLPGPRPVAVHQLELRDSARGRVFPCEVWRPEGAGVPPLVAYSHSSGGNRRSSSFLCRHLASHGYAVAALDHSEVVAASLRRSGAESAEQRAARVRAIVESRVPDVVLLLDRLLDGAGGDVDATRVGLVGHSFGGWTVLAAAQADARAGAVVALAPGGSTRPRPGILPVSLAFAGDRDIPTLYLTGDADVLIPLDRVEEVYRRTPGSTRMVVLRGADHQHFVDDIEGEHEALRTAEFDEESAWIGREMRPYSELCPAEPAHRFTCGLALCHFDASLRGSAAAAALLDGDVTATLAAHGVDGYAVTKS